MAVNPHTILKLTALVKAQQATLEDLNAALDKGKRDQYGRLKLTNAEGNMLWFKVSEALRLYKEFQE